MPPSMPLIDHRQHLLFEPRGFILFGGYCRYIFERIMVP
jgi:hypothetical protein